MDLIVLDVIDRIRPYFAYPDTVTEPAMGLGLNSSKLKLPLPYSLGAVMKKKPTTDLPTYSLQRYTVFHL